MPAAGRRLGGGSRRAATCVPLARPLRRQPRVPPSPKGSSRQGRAAPREADGEPAPAGGWAAVALSPLALATENTSGPSGFLFPAGAIGLQEQLQHNVHTAFTFEQLETLEKIFRSRNHLIGFESLWLAALLGMREEQVRFWFQNRRMRPKRNDLDYGVQLPGPVLLYSPGVQSSFSQNFPMYPPLTVQPVGLYSGLQYSLHCPVYQPPQTPPYQVLPPELMYHFPPQFSMPPDTQYASAFRPFLPAE